MRLGGSRIVGDQLDDSCELLDLESRMPQAEFGDRATGGVDHSTGRSRTATKGLEYCLAPRGRRLDSGRVGGDAKEANHVKAPPACTRNRIRSPQRRKGRVRQHVVHSAVVACASRGGESVVQGDLGITDTPEAGKASGADGVRLGFSGSVPEFGEFLRRRPHRYLDRVQTLRM